MNHHCDSTAFKIHASARSILRAKRSGESSASVAHSAGAFEESAQQHSGRRIK
jgi:hypothetical protein